MSIEAYEESGCNTTKHILSGASTKKNLRRRRLDNGYVVF